jgi:hypothetical protein
VQFTHETYKKMSKIEDLQDKLYEDFQRDIKEVMEKYKEPCQALGCQIRITDGGVSVIDYTGSRDKHKIICAESSLGCALIREIGKWHD